MTTKQELRDQRDRARVVVAELVAERNAALDELAAVRSERDDALAALTELRQADEPTTPTPRPFRVGDRVRVSEGATLKVTGGRTRPSDVAGKVGTVDGAALDGDLQVATDEVWDYVSPEFCTLIENEPERAAERVTLTLADGTRIEFDAVVSR